ncbi:MAG: sulfite exporter TauE/SafE family protein [Holophaga sp.]|jgi:hypothetical protein
MHPAWFEGAASLLAGLSGGLLSGLFGIGGGVVLIPMLSFALGLPQHQAQGVALAAMLLPNGLPAVIYLRRVGVMIHWSLVGMLTAGFLPAVWLGAVVANRIPDTPLRLGFACVLLVMAASLLRQSGHPPGRLPSAVPMGLDRAWLPGLAIGLAGGLASGLLGIGGGVIMVPLLVWMLRLPQREAQTTSLVFMLAPIGLPGVWVYAHSDAGLPWMALGGVALGFLGGAYLGARVAVHTRGRRLRQGFALLMAVMAAVLFRKGL